MDEQQQMNPLLMLANSIGGPLFGLGASIVGNLFGASNVNKTNKANMAINQKQIDAAYNMQAIQNRYQSEMYERQKLDNSIKAQAEQFRSAGLNPLAMLSQHASFAPQAAMTGAAGSVPGMLPMQSFQPDLSGVTQSALSLAQNRKTMAEARITENQAEFSDQRAMLDLFGAYEELSQKRYKTSFDYEQLELYKKELEYWNKTRQARISQQAGDANYRMALADQVEAQNFENTITRSLRVGQIQSQYNLTNREIQKISAEMSLLFEKVKTEKMTRQEINAQIANIYQSVEESKSRQGINEQNININRPHELKSGMTSKKYSGRGALIQYGIDSFWEFMHNASQSAPTMITPMRVP